MFIRLYQINYNFHTCVTMIISCYSANTHAVSLMIATVTYSLHNYHCVRVLTMTQSIIICKLWYVCYCFCVIGTNGDSDFVIKFVVNVQQCLVTANTHLGSDNGNILSTMQSFLINIVATSFSGLPGICVSQKAESIFYIAFLIYVNNVISFQTWLL